MTIDAKLEAVLFFKAEPLSIKKLAQIFKTDETEVITALGVLKEKLLGRGVTLIEKDDEVILGKRDLRRFRSFSIADRSREAALIISAASIQHSSCEIF